MATTAQTPYGKQVAAFQKGSTYVAGSPTKPQVNNDAMSSVYQKFNGAATLEQSQP